MSKRRLKGLQREAPQASATRTINDLDTCSPIPQLTKLIVPAGYAHDVRVSQSCMQAMPVRTAANGAVITHQQNPPGAATDGQLNSTLAGIETAWQLTFQQQQIEPLGGE